MFGCVQGGEAETAKTEETEETRAGYNVMSDRVHDEREIEKVKIPESQTCLQ